MLAKILVVWSYFLLTIYSQISISNITSTNMIGDAYNNGLYGGHGVMFADADGDGDADMYITMNNSSPMADLFFENQGNGLFIEKAAQRGIDNFDQYGSHGWVWADLDNDGDFDGWNGSYNENIPYRNLNNQPGFFENYFNTSGILNVDHGTRGVAAFDLDRDGDLDLFANNFYAYGLMEENECYKNNGNGTFTRIDQGLTFAKGDQGVCDGDFDNDGDIDLILSVFSDPDNPTRCVEIWENNNGQFTKVQNTGLNLCGTVDGVTFWDMNNDGWLDVVSGYKIFINNGNKTFTEISNVPTGMRIMRGIADLNNDGYWDLVSPGLNQVFINNGNLTFTPVNYPAGTVDDPRTVSFADIDGDGDVDFALGQKNYFNQLYRNNYSGNNKFLFINLKTANNQIGAFGAKVYLYSETGDTLLSYRQAKSNQGYLSQDDPKLHFGCGQRAKVKVKVVFLNGNVIQKIVNTNSTVNIYEANLFIQPPTNLSASIVAAETNKINLSWIDNASNESGYVIERKVGNSSSNSPFLVIDSVSANSISYQDSNFAPLTTYTYRVYAFGSQSASDYSNKISVFTPVPVELMSFSAKFLDRKVVLNWVTATETNNFGFEIQKKSSNNWTKIGFVNGAGNSSSIKKYSFIDDNIFGNSTLIYRLKQIDSDGSYQYSDVVEVTASPSEYNLYQNFPNPFNPTTSIEYTLPFDSKVTLNIHNSIGEVVATIIDQDQPAGFYSIKFNADDLTSGIYFYSISAKSKGNGEYFRNSKKMILLR